MIFVKGKAYHVYDYSIGRTIKIHIVELIEGDHIVYKFFGKHKQWWHYRIVDRQTLEFMYNEAVKEKSET